jgi:hypothetical protein
MHVHDPRFLEAIASMEGNKYDDSPMLEYVRRTYGISHCCAGQTNPVCPLHVQQLWELDQIPYVIYGDGGWNRYYVGDDGEVWFSSQHATVPDIMKARGLGFLIQ